MKADKGSCAKSARRRRRAGQDFMRRNSMDSIVLKSHCVGRACHTSLTPECSFRNSQQEERINSINLSSDPCTEVRARTHTRHGVVTHTYSVHFSSGCPYDPETDPERVSCSHAGLDKRSKFTALPLGLSHFSVVNSEHPKLFSHHN